jgi:hypothetical protein
VTGDDWRSDKYLQTEARLGENLGAWLNVLRTGEPRVSWQDSAYELRSATGVKVTHETCRTWLALWKRNRGTTG